jgi:hypothetical protein
MISMNIVRSVFVLIGIVCATVPAAGQQDSIRAITIKILYTAPAPDRWQWSRGGYQGDWGYCRYTRALSDAAVVLLYERLNKSNTVFTDVTRSDHRSFFIEDSLIASVMDSTIARPGVVRKRVAFDVTRVVVGSKEHRPCEKSRMYEGFYFAAGDSSLVRRVLVIHFACGSVHVQILCDSPKSLYDTLKTEMEDFVGSIRLSNE